jgi:hypothetical protein
VCPLKLGRLKILLRVSTLFAVVSSLLQYRSNLLLLKLLGRTTAHPAPRHLRDGDWSLEIRPDRLTLRLDIAERRCMNCNLIALPDLWLCLRLESCLLEIEFGDFSAQKLLGVN